MGKIKQRPPTWVLPDAELAFKLQSYEFQEEQL